MTFEYKILHSNGSPITYGKKIKKIQELQSSICVTNLGAFHCFRFSPPFQFYVCYFQDFVCLQDICKYEEQWLVRHMVHCYFRIFQVFCYYFLTKRNFYGSGTIEAVATHRTSRGFRKMHVSFCTLSFNDLFVFNQVAILLLAKNL